MKKYLFVSLTILMVVSLGFAGGQPQTPTAARPAGGPLDPYDPPLEVSMWRGLENRNFLPGQSHEDNIWTRAIEEKLGIRFRYVWTSPATEFQAKLNTSLAAGDLPDLLTRLNIEQYYNLARAGRLAPLGDALERFDLGFIRTYLDFGGGVHRSMVTLDGEIYGWGRGPAVADVRIFSARNDWLENVGREMPETYEDIIDVLYAFTNEDPNRSGRRDTYGLGASNAFLGGGMPLNVFFALHESYPEIWVEQSGRLVFGALTTETKDALRALRQLHADGVLSPEWPVLGVWSEAPDEVARGRVGAAFGQQWWHNWPAVAQTVIENPGMYWEHSYPRTVSGNYMKNPVTAQVTTINAMNRDFGNPEVLVKLSNLYDALRHQPDTADGDFHTIVTADGGRVSTFFYWADVFAGPLFVDFNVRLARDVIEAMETGDTSRLLPEARGYYNGAREWLSGGGRSLGNDGPYGNWRTFAAGGTQELAMTMIDGGHFIIDAFQGAPTRAQTQFAGDLRSKRDELFIQMIVGELNLDAGWDQWLRYWDVNGGRDWTEQVNEWHRTR